MLRHVLSGLRPGSVSGSFSWTNTYNANGMRTKRTDGTNTYEYIYNGDKLMQMKKNGEVINFTYVGNTPATMTYQGNTFYYVVNAQGDVTGMTNSAGKLVISYTYDAWGRWVYYIQDTEWSNVLGGINPLLYRGYLYDIEIGLYYLQSRYYDMNTHRFLNADVFTATGQGFIGNNMFTYCLNNPVLYMDVLGYFADYACLDEDPLDEESRINRSGGSASALDIFMRSLQCAADGLSMAAGNRSYLSTENHHVLSNKNSTYSSNSIFANPKRSQ